MDHTTIHPLCESQAHLIELHLWRGAPKNLDETRPIQVLVNHGYVVGFCPERLQPAWSAYCLGLAKDELNHERPPLYFDDMRLDEAYRIGRKTFGRIGGVQLNVGHMTPNAAINRQFGRLAQMETFMMSNMSPQYESLNSGVWRDLEKAIREIEDEPRKADQVWVIVGPIFGEEPESVYRGRGKHLPVPESYFCIVVDSDNYPYDTPSKVDIDCFIIQQGAPRSSRPEEYPATLEDVEEATNLKFFASWGRELTLGSTAQEEPRSESRLMHALHRRTEQAKSSQGEIETALREATTIEDLIKALRSEANRIQTQGRALTDDEITRLQSIQHTVSWLIRALEISGPLPAPAQPANLITYKVTADIDGKLRKGARTACNFWNRFVEPKYSIVIRLGTFTQNSNTIAVAYRPYDKDGVKYGRVSFNTKFLSRYSDNQIAGTIVHEIGHTLGIGWDDWDGLYDRRTGKFTPGAVRQLSELQRMEVERDGGPGTAYAHWDERRFDKELMTGAKDPGEHVLPVTIDLMKVLGHTVIERLDRKTDLDELLQEVANMVFLRQDEVRSVDLEHFVETVPFETIPHEPLDLDDSAKPDGP